MSRHETKDEVILDIIRRGVEGHDRNEGRKGARFEHEQAGIPSLALLAERIRFYATVFPMGEAWMQGYKAEWREILDAAGVAWN